jgi:hypothetical protein
VGKFDLPPDVEDLAQRGFTPRVVPAGTALWRVHTSRGPHALPWNEPRRYGPKSRFDPHPPPVGDSSDVGVLYTATTLATCLAEVFQHTRVVDRSHGRPVATSWLTTRDLTLIDLQGQAALRLGAADAINGEAPRALTQAWARALVAAFPTVDGFWHRSAMDGGDCACLVTGPSADATTALPADPDFSRALDEGRMVSAVAQAAGLIGFAVI